MTKVEKLILENQIIIMQAIKSMNEISNVNKEAVTAQVSKTFNALRDNK
jgi:hypothetical protein